MTTTAKPDTPSLVSPANGATTSDSTPTFRWQNVSEGDESRIMAGRDAGFGSVALDTKLFGTEFSPGTPLAEGTYYWKVQTDNGCQLSDWSATWQLTIGQADHAIYLPLLVRGR